MENNSKRPTFGHGKICYLEIPATDIERSTAFYKNVFGWRIRKSTEGHMSFDDGVGEVSGMWLVGHEPHTDPRLIVSIMVDNAVATLEAIVAYGGNILEPLGPSQPEGTAMFSDPAGNVFRIYQHQGKAEREIVITRVINAPRKLVWEAFTDPKHLEQWWGPNGFSTRTAEFSFKPGGAWRHVMRGPDGREYPNGSIFKEIVPYERITYAHGGGEGDTNDAQFDATITFEDLDGKTKVTLHSLFISQAARDYVVRTYDAIEGGKQNLERLAEYVETQLQ